MDARRRPDALSITPMELMLMPLPRPDTTPPVTTMYFILADGYRGGGQGQTCLSTREHAGRARRGAELCRVRVGKGVEVWRAVQRRINTHSSLTHSSPGQIATAMAPARLTIHTLR